MRCTIFILGSIHNSVSRNYHRDCTVLTLFRTFVGPGMEWVPEENVRREAFIDQNVQRDEESDEIYLLNKVVFRKTDENVVGILKGKSAIAVARQFGGRKRNFNGENFWARGYAVSTV